jgi:hypothetical protein
MRRIRSGRWIALGLLTAVVAVECLNFTGFCYSGGRYYGDRELEDIAIAHVLKHQDAADRERNKLYRSVAELRAENPNCCRVYRSGSLIPDLILGRAFGFYISVANVTYRSNDTPGIENYYDAYFHIDACGQVRRIRGIPERNPPGAQKVEIPGAILTQRPPADRSRRRAS